MYPVSEAFLQAVQENTRRCYWTGKITTKAGGRVFFFRESGYCEGSGYIIAQCCGSTEIELGTSKNDKNISGLLNQIEARKISIHTLINASVYSVADTNVRIISIEFASKEETNKFIPHRCKSDNLSARV